MIPSGVNQREVLFRPTVAGQIKYNIMNNICQGGKERGIF